MKAVNVENVAKANHQEKEMLSLADSFTLILSNKDSNPTQLESSNACV